MDVDRVISAYSTSRNREKKSLQSDMKAFAFVRDEMEGEFRSFWR